MTKRELSRKIANEAQLRLNRFAAEWMKNGGNAAKASRTLWPHLSPAVHRVNGSKLLRRARIVGLLDALVAVERRAMGVDELIQRQSEVARANILDCVDVAPDGSFAFNIAKAQKAGMGPLIKRLSHDAESGAPVIELYGADEARKVLGRWNGLGAEKATPPVTPAMTVMVNVLAQLPADVHRAVFKALLAQRTHDDVVDVDATHLEPSIDADPNDEA